MSLDQETIAQQFELLAAHRRTLAALLQQQALLGGRTYVTPGIINGIAEAQDAIRGIKEQLRGDGVLVADGPNDDAQSLAVAPPSRLSPQEQHNRSRMLDRVEAFWVKGVLDQSLYQIARVELGLEHNPDAVEYPWEGVIRRPDLPRQPIPLGKPIIEVFDDLGGELLILGAPGAGKTTFLLELARDLIVRARQNEQHPIPVVFNLSTWATKRQTLDKWLVEELNQRYDVPRKVAQGWVATNTVLPLLDGLDEVVTQERDACVAAINGYRTTADVFIPVVVCCREVEYAALTEKLRLAGAIAVQPLTKHQLDEYLKPKVFLGVRTLLRDDSTLWDLLDTPLMLSIVVLAYKDRSAMQIRRAATLEERRQQLFDDYIATMFTRRSKETRYARGKTLQYLVWLAQQMQRQAQTIIFVERLQPSWLPTRAACWQYVLIDRFSVGLISGLIFGCVAATITELGYGPHRGLATGVVVGLMSIVVSGLFGGKSESHSATQWGWWLSLSSILSWLGFGLMGGLIYGVVYGLVNDPTGGLVFAVIYGQIFGGVGLIIGALAGKPSVRPREIMLVETLKWSWSRAIQSIPAGLGVGLLIGVIYNLIVQMIAKLGRGLEIGLITGLGSLLAWGILSGVVAGLGGGLSGNELETKAIPNQGIWRSARSAVLGSLTGGLSVGLIGGLSVGLVTAPIFGLSTGLVLGLFMALVFGLVFGGYACLSHLTLRLVLARNGFLPLRLVPFLDECAERIFLRKVGGGYIFVHRLLMEHFASMHSERSDNT